ncbi:sulfatase-like hydrolase/transferase [Humisphaera borealis]|uniref:Sulfatase-like hydrolase/transferase n=1 Tax=Humisphaera borealis TaxID=2807512 RepID=A0A7M2WXB3_9BACT|nr:sulfatase-like hydrolase/transferase [Humisphaera borealis]QOV90049.1 sulfatase-like hydrolase/transferase [Humisphaera borealis]
MNKLTPIAFLLALIASCVTADANTRPNLVLILADDLGYETIGANGGTSYKTPVLDNLAAAGVRFTRCYAQPLCTPTRAQLMTGQYNVRNYINFGDLERSQTTFGNLLKQAGYATAIAGKWQLGHEVGLPQKFGFDESYLWQHTRRPPRYANPGLEHNGKELDFSKGEYGPDMVNDFALDFISRKKDQPFLLYYTMMLTHDPFQPTPDSKDWDPGRTGEKDGKSPAHFGDMVAYMDKLIGKLVARLDELKIRDNTLILFVGDNGTSPAITSMMGDRKVQGGKGKSTAAGMHVPLIASWPAGIARGTVCDDLIDTTDFLPTLLSAAGVAPPRDLTLDGTSFLPQLRGEPGTPRQWVYSWYAREGGPKASKEFAADKRYKLYRDGEMFDVSADILEKAPLNAAALSPDAKTARQTLQAALDKYKDARPASIAKQAGKAGND